jgi:hypothetical protein
MTIFLDIAKHFLQPEITRIKESSDAADQSLLNGALNFFGVGRDTKLSSGKRQILGVLMADIGKYQHTSTDEDDKATYAQLRDLIINSKMSIMYKSRSEKHAAGATEDALGRLGDFLTEIFHRLEGCNLLNIDHDEEPLNQFRYFAAFYHAQEIQTSRQKSGFGELLENPNINAMNQLLLDKADLVSAQVIKCDGRLQALDSAHPDYSSTKRQIVCEGIEELKRQNEALCKGYSYRVVVSSVVNKFVSPTRDALDEVMTQALAAIDSIEKNTTQNKLRSSVKIL